MEREHDMEVMRACVAGYLEHIRQVDESRMALEDEMRRLRSSLEIKTTVMSGMPHAESRVDRMAEGMARLLELRAQWAASTADSYREHGEAMAFCYATLERRYCWMHWVHGISWRSLAKREHYHEKTILRKANDGVREIYAWMPEEWRRALPNAQPWEEFATPMLHN